MVADVKTAIREGKEQVARDFDAEPDFFSQFFK